MKIGILKLVLLCVIITCGLNIKAQGEKTLSPKKLQKDFKELKKVIEAHPDPFTHISEEDFNSKFDSVKSTLNVELSGLEFYKKSAYIIALLKDGHSQALLPELWIKKQRKKVGALPYEFHLTDNDELYVLKKYRDEGMPVRAKILKINNIKTDSFLRKIDPFISYELKSFRNTKIDNTFEEYLYIAFGFSNNTEFEYSSSGTISAEKVENIPYKEWKKFIKDDREEREIRIAKGTPYSYEKISNGVGLIKIFAFTVNDWQAYNIFLNKTFKSIQKDNIHSIVIDLRGNYGGWPIIGSKLFHYISNTHFKTMAKSSTKVSHAFRENFLERNPFLIHNQIYIPKRKHFIDINSILNDPIGSFFNEDKFFNEEPEAENYEFTGDCYLMTNRDSYSAASMFASTFQCYQMGIIIGEETGGTKIFRANPIYEELSKSGVRVGMSTTKLYTTCYDKEFEGVEPTIKYTPTIFEITSGLDTQLFFTQRIIKKIQAEKSK